MIRHEEVGDAAAIHAVNVAAFERRAEADLVDALRAAGRLLLSLVAEEEGTIVGHVAFSPVTIDGPAGRSLGIGLGPLAVLPPRQRQGFGSELVRRGISELAPRRQTMVVLGNPRYYARFGFAPASRHGLDSEYNAGDAFMVLAPTGEEAAIPAGRVRYAPEFAGV